MVGVGPQERCGLCTPTRTGGAHISAHVGRRETPPTKWLTHKLLFFDVDTQRKGGRHAKRSIFAPARRPNPTHTPKTNCTPLPGQVLHTVGAGWLGARGRSLGCSRATFPASQGWQINGRRRRGGSPSWVIYPYPRNDYNHSACER